MSYDELELDTLGDRKTALFLIMSDTDTPLILLSLSCNHSFSTCFVTRQTTYGGKLPVHVRFCLTSLRTSDRSPLDKLIATIRSREISASIILQSQSQLKAIYKDAAEIILGMRQHLVFGRTREKCKRDFGELGKETIDSFNTSENRGTQVSHGLNYQKLGKDMPYLFVKSSVALNLS